MAKKYSSFLGANTPRGFVSFFDELYNPYKNWRCFIIKGGPGTGKSHIMKSLGERLSSLGYDTEWVYCSSDPESLDALIAPEIKLAAADGTSPHILEPVFPGASENIINTGDFWDKQSLFASRDKIRTLTLENSLCHRQSSRYLAAAGSINDETLRLTEKYIDKDKLHGFALRFAARELPIKKGASPGKRLRRFISAITPEGPIFLDSTPEAFAHRIIGIEDEFTCGGSQLVDTIGELAVKNGYDVIFCHCPLKPKGPCEHIIIPQAHLALINLRSAHKTTLRPDRIIHIKRFLYEGLGDYSCSLRFNRRLVRELTGEAVRSLAQAKAIHDELESIYGKAMDFVSLEAYCKDLFKKFA